MKPTKRERIDTWLKKQKVGYKFYAREIGDALGLTGYEVAVYLKWHKRAMMIVDAYQSGPNWVVV